MDGKAETIQADRNKRYDCPTCGRLLFVGFLAKSSIIQVKCHNRRCGNKVGGNFITVAAAS